MLKKSIVIVTLAALVAGSAALAQNPPVSPSPVKRTVIGKTEVPGANYDVISAMVEIAPGFKAGRHFHPGAVQVQVLDGEFWLALDGQPEKTYTAVRRSKCRQRRFTTKARWRQADETHRRLCGRARPAAGQSGKIVLPAKQGVYFPCTTLLRSVPMPVISISTVSPGLMFSGTPSVPIHITSPGSMVQYFDTSAM